MRLAHSRIGCKDAVIEDSVLFGNFKVRLHVSPGRGDMRRNTEAVPHTLIKLQSCVENPHSPSRKTIVFLGQRQMQNG